MNLARATRTALATGLPFGVVMGLVFTLQRGPTAGLLLGVVSGLLFGALLAGFTEAQRKRMQLGGDFEGEKILLQGPANHWRGAEARGGWLVLTPKRLVFRSHGKNIQNQGAEVLVADITACEPANTLLLVPNGLRVRHGAGAVDKFVVTARAEWLAALAAAAPR